MNDTFKKIRELKNEQIKELFKILNLQKFNKEYHNELNKFILSNNLNTRLTRREIKIHLEASIHQKIDRLPKHVKERLLDLYNYNLIEEEFFDSSHWNSIIEKYNLGISPKEYKPFLIKV